MQVVDLQRPRAAERQALAVQRQVDVAGHERHQAGEGNLARAHARCADDQRAAVVQAHAHVVQRDAAVADLDQAALHLDLRPRDRHAEVDGLEIDAAVHLWLVQHPRTIARMPAVPCASETASGATYASSPR